jgi:hypothetical protein
MDGVLAREVRLPAIEDLFIRKALSHVAGSIVEEVTRHAGEHRAPPIARR